MRLYFAGPTKADLPVLKQEAAENLLISFADKVSLRNLDDALSRGFGVALDSGAYSVVSQGRPLDPAGYIAFLHRYAGRAEFCVNLDVCTDPEATVANQAMLEAEGFAPMPVHHFGEDESWLHPLLDRYEYIGLGNSILSKNRPHQQFIEWASGIASRWPDHKFHGFAVGAIVGQLGGLYSADSTAWLVGAQYKRLLGRYGQTDARRIDTFLEREDMVRNNIRALLWRAEHAKRLMAGERLPWPDAAVIA